MVGNAIGIRLRLSLENVPQSVFDQGAKRPSGIAGVPPGSEQEGIGDLDCDLHSLILSNFDGLGTLHGAGVTRCRD